MSALLKSVLGVPFCCFPCFGTGGKKKLTQSVNGSSFVEGLCDPETSVCPLSIFKDGKSTGYEQNTEFFSAKRLLVNTLILTTI